MPEHCRTEQCVTLLSSHQYDTGFVVEHINHLQLYVKVVWFGDNLRSVIEKLYDENAKKPTTTQKSFIVVHWTPSEVIDANIEYESIVMPRCEDFLLFNPDAMCKYELMPILMYCSKKFMEKTSIFEHLFNNIYIDFDQSNEKYLLKLYNNLTDAHQKSSSVSSARHKHENSIEIENSSHQRPSAHENERIYNEIACDFLRELSETSEMKKQIEFVNEQMAKKPKQQVFIGGIYPKKEEQKNEHNGWYLICGAQNEKV